MKIIRMMLMLLGLYVSNMAYGVKLPEFHGLYAVDGGKLIEIELVKGKSYDLSSSFQFINYHGGQWQLKKVVFVRNKIERNVAGQVMGVEPINKWESVGDWIEMRTKPVPGAPDMIYEAPREPWTTGAYAMLDRHTWSIIVMLYINKKEPLLRQSECVDRDFDIKENTGHEKYVPCKTSAPEQQGTGGANTSQTPASNATPSTAIGAGTNTGASGKASGTQQTNAAKELSKFLNSTPVAEEEERRFVREEAARAARLNSPDLLRLKQSRRDALKRNDYQGIIDPSLQILQIDPADYESLDYLANLYTAVNEPDKALVYAAECLKRVVRPRTFALITQAYLMKKDKKNTLLWLERTLQSKYPHHPAEAALNQAFTEDQGEISRIFNKHRTTSGASTVSPGLAQNQPGAAQNAQSQPNVVEGVASVFKSIIGGVTSALPRQDAAATPSKTSQAVTEAPQAPASAPASVPLEKAAATASGILESVERRQKVFPLAPDYLYETSSFTGAVSSTWLEMTSGMLGTKGLRDKYEEFYLSAVDYRNLSQVQLIRAKRYAEKGDAKTASHFLKSADHYLELFNLSRQGAEQAYLGNIDAAAELARGIYEGSKKAVSFGGDALGPAGSRVVDIVFTATDFAVQASDVGVSQALKETLADILAEAVLKSVPDSSLGGKTLSEAITKKTTKVIGSSQAYGILKAASGSAKFSKAFTTLLAKSTASELNSLTKDQVAKIVLGLGEENPQVVAQNKP